jgi:hypothetical protein
MKYREKLLGFSLAEMMIVMLIISVVTAAMLPVITKRANDSGAGHSLWTESSSNSSDIYSREAPNAVAIVGANGRIGTGSEKLQINSGATGSPQIAFAENSVLTGALLADGSNDLFLGSITKDAASTNNNIVIGQQDLLVGANFASVLGANAKAGKEGVSVGYGANSYGQSNTAVGYGALALSSTVSANTAIGHGALATNTSGYDNTAVGEGSLGSSTASVNAAFGSDALQRDSSGTSNTALGTYAMSYNEDGSNNTAVGFEANNQTDLKSFSGTSVFGSGAYARGNNSISIGFNTYTIGNSAQAIGFGSYATSDNAIAIGPSAQATSASAIAIGNGAVANGFYYGQLKEAIAIGMGAIASHVNALALGDATISSGEGSVALGKNSWAQSDSTVALGHTARSRGLNSIAIGNATVASGDHSIAIGDLSQATAQNVTALGYDACANVTGSNKTCIGANSGPGYYDSQASDTSEVVYIGTPTSTVYIPGNLVVGKTTIMGARSVNDNINYPVYLKGGNKGASSSWVFLGTDDYKGGDDNFYRVGSVTAGPFTINGDNGVISSDRRLKNVKDLNNEGLEKINELKVYNYNFKKDKKHLPHVGVIAQDLQKVFPNSVKKGRNGYLVIRWDEMFYAMLNSIKELDLKFTKLNEKMQKFSAFESSTDKKIDALTKQMNTKYSSLSNRYNSLNNQLYTVKKENKALKAQLKRSQASKI